MIKKFLIILFCFSISINFSVKAKKPCGRAFKDISYEGKMLKRSLPLSLNMPYDIMRAYLTIYNIQTHTDYKSFEKFLEQQHGFTDTLRSLFASYYKLQDYDPILLEKYNIHGYKFFDSRYTYLPSIFERDLKNYISKKSPLPYLDYMLIKCEFINQIKVSNVKKISNTGNDYYMVTSTIIDNIKGKVIPNCQRLIMPESSYEPDTLIKTIPAVPDACFIFGMDDESHHIANESYDEFISFAVIQDLCTDSSNNYENFYYNILENKFTDWPFIPISNGKVLDTNNVFGFGTNLNVNEWKKKLRQRIYEIKNGLMPITDVSTFKVFKSRFLIYPNPASEKIIIEANINNIGDVLLTITNCLGEKINVFANKSYLGNGYYRFELSTISLNSGMYYCILKDGNYFETKPFFVIH